MHAAITRSSQNTVGKLIQGLKLQPACWRGSSAQLLQGSSLLQQRPNDLVILGATGAPEWLKTQLCISQQHPSCPSSLNSMENMLVCVYFPSPISSSIHGGGPVQPRPGRVTQAPTTHGLAAATFPGRGSAWPDGAKPFPSCSGRAEELQQLSLACLKQGQLNSL